MSESTQEQPTQEHEAQTSVDIDADPEEVWDALTSSGEPDSWHGEGSVIGEEPGDSLYISDPATGRPKSGIVERVVDNELLEYTWWPIDDPDAASRVAITLLPTPAGTRVRVTERPLYISALAPTSMQVSHGPTASLLVGC